MTPGTIATHCVAHPAAWKRSGGRALSVGNGQTNTNGDAMTDQNERTDVFMTVPEVADRFRVSKMTIYRLCDSGALQYIRVGASMRIYKDTVDQYERDNRTGK